jgi:hypothetical protein
MHPAQVVARLDAEVVDQQPAGPGVLGERVGPPPRVRQRHHQLPAQALPQREPLDQGGQVADDRPLAADGDLQVGPFLDGHRVLLVQRHRPLPHHPALQAVQRPPPPQVQGGAHQRPGAVRIGRREAARLLDMVGELQRVQVVPGDADAVTGPVGPDHVGGQDLAQPGHRGLQLGLRRRRRLVVPQRVDQVAGRHRRARPQQQHRQHGALPPGGDLGTGHHERAQDAEPHPRPGPAARRRHHPA